VPAERRAPSVLPPFAWHPAGPGRCGGCRTALGRRESLGPHLADASRYGLEPSDGASVNRATEADPPHGAMV